MKRPPRGRRHLDTRILLDYLEDRLDPRGSRAVEDHLAGSCSRCRELLHEVGRLVDAMRGDRTPAVPPDVRARALEAFAPRPARESRGLGAWRWASLLFDSRVEPLPAAVRRSVGEARWLRFSLDEHVLEIEAEPETGDLATVRGWLGAPEPELHRIELRAGDEVATVWPDAGGSFSLERVPLAGARMTVQGPSRRWRLPALEP
jgi:hypothetical protein